MPDRTKTASLNLPPPGHGDFWASVHVRFYAPISPAAEPSGRALNGYYRNFGIRSVPTRVQVAIADAVDDGAVDWGETEWNLVDPACLDPDIQSSIQAVTGDGIWYKSGRIMYSDDGNGS